MKPNSERLFLYKKKNYSECKNILQARIANHPLRAQKLVNLANIARNGGQLDSCWQPWG